MSGGVSRQQRAYSNHVTEARWGSWGPGGQGQEALAEISPCFISCSRGSPLSFSPVTTKEEHYHPDLVTNMPFFSPAQYLCPVSPSNLMSTSCQLHKQCQEGIGVTKPVGVGGVCVGKRNPIILQALAPPPPQRTLP